jgi:hypothetical protein
MTIQEHNFKMNMGEKGCFDLDWINRVKIESKGSLL